MIWTGLERSFSFALVTVGICLLNGSKIPKLPDRVTQPLLCLPNQRLHNLHRPLEFDLVFRSWLHHTRATRTPPRPAVHPHQIVTPKRNPDVHLVDVLATRWLLRRDRLQDLVELADELLRAGVGRGERLWDGVLQGGCPVWTDRRGDLEVGALWGAGHSEDGTGGWRCEPSCDACRVPESVVSDLQSMYIHARVRLTFLEANREFSWCHICV